jgi:glutamate synthase (NADPH) small chain
MQKREIMNCRDSKDRIKDFKEVALGFDNKQAMNEAKRCLQCKAPQCVKGCPVSIDIPKFIKCICNNEIDNALNIILEKNNLPAICGRVCPQEAQCEKSCILSNKNEGIAIGTLERFAADNGKKNKIIKKPKTNKKIAVIGSGPSGLTCAGECAKLGHEVTVFESLHSAGGVLRYGIPSFRLPSHILDQEINYIQSLGVEFKLNTVIGLTKTIEDLKNENYDAMFIGTGAGLPKFLEIPNENLNGIYSANEFLTRTNLMKANEFPKYDTPVKIGEKAVVIGGGNVAIDASRILKRLGVKDVTVMYRRTIKEMPARLEEIKHAEEEQIKFLFLTAPLEFVGDDKNNVIKIKCQKMSLKEDKESGKYIPSPIIGSDFFVDVSTVIVAVGQGSNPLLVTRIKDLKLNSRNHVHVNHETMATNIDGIYAGGDIVTGADTVISAMGAGKRAAKSIDEYLHRTRL